MEYYSTLADQFEASVYLAAALCREHLTFLSHFRVVIRSRLGRVRGVSEQGSDETVTDVLAAAILICVSAVCFW